MRIGLISDTHIPTAAKELWPQVYDAFRGVEPVVAVWGNGDFRGWQRTVPPEDPRLSEAKVLTVGDLRIGLVHDLQLPEHPPLRTLDGQMHHYFRGPVDVIVRGSTHAAEITELKGVLIVNPGSPTFPNHQSTRLGTIGFLEIEDGVARPSIVQLM